jgi:hypothetical protein
MINLGELILLFAIICICVLALGAPESIILYLASIFHYRPIASVNNIPVHSLWILMKGL